MDYLVQVLFIPWSSLLRQLPFNETSLLYLAGIQGFHNSLQELHTLGQSIDLSHQAIDAAKRAAGNPL